MQKKKKCIYLCDWMRQSLLKSRSFWNMIQMTEKRNETIHFSNSFSVSLSQCVPGEPSPELVHKYNEMKHTFLLRLNHFYRSVMALIQPALESPEMQQVQASIDERKLNAFINFME